MASIGLKAGAPWDPGKLDPAIRKAFQDGLNDARADMKKRGEGGIDAAKFFGTPTKVCPVVTRSNVTSPCGRGFRPFASTERLRLSRSARGDAQLAARSAKTRSINGY